MILRKLSRSVRGVLAVAAAMIVVLTLSRGGAQASGGPALTSADFTPAMAEGFGDRTNTWAWSMKWWNNKLYVGTNRSYSCITGWMLYRTYPGAVYPPASPDVSCPKSPADITMSAEIWQWTPETNTWLKVFESPNDIPNPDYSGKFVPPEWGLRTTTDFVDASGKDYLFFGGVNTADMWSGKVPPPRLLYTTDGVYYTGVPQDPGTVMGNLVYSSFRGLTSYNGQLFVINGTEQGAGFILASSNPTAGDNAWQQVSPPGSQFYDMEVFNGWLYVGVMDTVNGYAVWKTQATGTPPYTFIPVVTNGGYFSPHPSAYAISMHVFDGRLYVGTASPAEWIRINSDDTWDLVMGTPRQRPDQTWIYPLTGFQEGFNNELDLHVYRQGDHNGWLYAGTYDATIRWKPKVPGPATLDLMNQMGADLFATQDGWYLTPVTTNGFGSMWDYSIRNFADTPLGFFVGTLNEYYGLDVMRATDPPPPAILPPGRLQIEISHSQPVLSWDPVPNAVAYHVLRSFIATANLPPQPGNPNSGIFTYPSSYVEITPSTGTPDTVYVDQAIAAPSQYIYKVVAQDAAGNQSADSNIVLGPPVVPTPTFTGALSFAATLQQRGRFTTGGEWTTTQQALQVAQADAAAGNLAGASDVLKNLGAQVQQGQVVLSPDSKDLEVVLDQLLRRLKLAQAGLVDVGTLN